MITKVRKMRPQDKAAVMQILNTTSEFKPFEVTVAEELIDAFLEEGDSSGYPTRVAVVANEICGYICFGETPLTIGTWDIYWIAVEKSKQGKGIGKSLMAAVEKEIAKLSGRLILIETSSTEEYEKTRLFYSSIGYTVVCSINDFYLPGDNKVILEKRLGHP